MPCAAFLRAPCSTYGNFLLSWQWSAVARAKRFRMEPAVRKWLARTLLCTEALKLGHPSQNLAAGLAFDSLSRSTARVQSAGDHAKDHQSSYRRWKCHFESCAHFIFGALTSPSLKPALQAHRLELSFGGAAIPSSCFRRWPPRPAGPPSAFFVNVSTRRSDRSCPTCGLKVTRRCRGGPNLDYSKLEPLRSSISRVNITTPFHA